MTREWNQAEYDELVFDETYYRNQYPDVVSAIQEGFYINGRQHWNMYGKKAGRSPNRYYDEQKYLNENPEVVEAVESGLFNSGLEHWLRWGIDGGLAGDSSLYKEKDYKKLNPGVVMSINAGTYPSGLYHCLKWNKNNSLKTIDIEFKETVIIKPDDNIINTGLLININDNLIRLIEAININTDAVQEQSKLQKQIFEFLKETNLKNQNNMISTDDLRVIEENSKLYAEKVQKIIDQGHASITYEQMEDIILGNIDFVQS